MFKRWGLFSVLAVKMQSWRYSWDTAGICIQHGTVCFAWFKQKLGILTDTQDPYLTTTSNDTPSPPPWSNIEWLLGYTFLSKVEPESLRWEIWGFNNVLLSAELPKPLTISNNLAFIRPFPQSHLLNPTAIRHLSWQGHLSKASSLKVQLLRYIDHSFLSWSHIWVHFFCIFQSYTLFTTHPTCGSRTSNKLLCPPTNNINLWPLHSPRLSFFWIRAPQRSV